MHTRRLSKRALREEVLFLCLALPSLLGLVVFFAAPFGASLWLALVDNAVLGNFVGLENFAGVLQSGAFQLAAQNTLAFILICVPVNMLFPLGMAMLLRRAGRQKSLFGLFFLLPLVIPSGSIVHFWKSLFGVNGILNGAFFAAEPVNWVNSGYARAIITLVFMWKNAGYNMVLYLAGLEMIPREYYECASLEGAGSFKQFTGITLVYIAPASFLVFLMSVINSFKSFKEIWLLAGAYPHNSIYMLQHYMNNQFTALNYQKLSAASYILSAGIIVVAAALFRFQHRLSDHY